MLIENLPDVSQIQKAADWGSPLPLVGMSEVDLPVNYQGLKVPAQADFYVNLVTRESRGIHMSRLYSLLTDKLATENLSLKLLEEILELGLKSHQDLSTFAQLKLRMNLPLRRTSLKSELQGWRVYPVEWVIEKSATRTRVWLTVSILYSSTCPASAALAFQIHSEQKNPSGFAATPHAQRSSARVTVEVESSKQVSLESLIDLLESSLGTPVQTLVKRQDEQQFAILNAQNLMFCEDAARRLVASLNKTPWILDFKGEVRHLESLHAHNATAHFQK
jgi:GTP cyclohydrolase I